MEYHLTFLVSFLVAYGIGTSVGAQNATSTVLYRTNGSQQNSDKLLVKYGMAYVGGTNYFLEIYLNKSSPDNIKLVNFTATEKFRNLCKRLSPDAHCENTVRIVEFTSKESILICGTNAKRAKCYHYNIKNSTFKETSLDARSWVSESPATKTVSLLTKSNLSDEELYVASIPSAAIGGVFAKRTATPLKTTKDWFDDPEFKGIYHVAEKDYVYLFFNEKSTFFVGSDFDASNQRKDIYSMVARVCKNDRGGSWKTDTWMTFSKVRLVCPWPGMNTNSEENLYYNELVSSFQTNDSIFGLFTTNRNWNLATYALAEYDTNAIDDVINGKFFPDNKTWFFNPSKTDSEVTFEPSEGDPPFYPGQCPVTLPYTLKSEFEEFMLQNTLLKMNVLPKGGKPSFVGDSKARFKFLFIQTLSWCKLVFLLAGDGYLRKIVLHLDGTTDELFERQMLPVSKVGDMILSAKLVEEKGFILAITATKVVTIRLQLCSFSTDCNTCNMDPHCEWRADFNTLKLGCEVADKPQRRTCSAPPETPKNLSVEVGEDVAEISWKQDGVPAQIFNIVTVGVHKTREIIHRKKTADKKLLIKRSILQDGCVYDVTATAVNDTTPSAESRWTFQTGLQKPQLTVYDEHGAYGVGWTNVSGAAKYAVSLADSVGNIMQEIFLIPTSSNHKFFFPNLDIGKKYTVTVRAVSEDNVESTAYIGVIRSATAEVSASTQCMAVTFALAVFVALFVCLLFVMIHNIWTIKPRVNELRSDEDGCSYKRQYLLIWSKRQERSELKCDGAVMSTTSA